MILWEIVQGVAEERKKSERKKSKIWEGRMESTFRQSRVLNNGRCQGGRPLAMHTKGKATCFALRGVFKRMQHSNPVNGPVLFVRSPNWNSPCGADPHISKTEQTRSTLELYRPLLLSFRATPPYPVQRRGPLTAIVYGAFHSEFLSANTAPPCACHLDYIPE